MNDISTTQRAEPGSPRLIVRKIYLKDVSFETPMGVGAFQQNWKPVFDQQLQTTNNKIGEDLHEVILTITLRATLGEKDKEQTAFIAEVQQAGIFKFSNANTEQEKQMINAACPTILFPYVRESIDNLVIKAGFPAISLRPINFETLYQQALQQHSPAASH